MKRTSFCRFFTGLIGYNVALVAFVTSQLMLSVIPSAAIIVQTDPQLFPTQDSLLTANKNSTLLFRTGLGSCSATLIGPRVVLTAARCLVGETAFEAETNYGPYSLECELISDFTKNDTLDLSLCLLNKEFPGIPVKVSTDANRIQKYSVLRMVGYGCVKAGGVDGQYGAFTHGSARIIRTAQPKDGRFDIVTLGDTLCQGDAGGGAYTYENNEYFLVGVNSRSDLVAKSRISATVTTTFSDWALDWASRQGPDIFICGLSTDGGCDRKYTEASEISNDQLASKFSAGARFVGVPNADFVFKDDFLQVSARANETIDNVVTRVCGVQQPDDFYLQYQNLSSTKKVNRGIKNTTKLAEGKMVIIPLCAAASVAIKFAAISDQDTADLWQQYVVGRNKKDDWFGYDRGPSPNKNGLKSRYFIDVFKELNPTEKNIPKLTRENIVAIPLVPWNEEETKPVIFSIPEGDSAVFGFEGSSKSCTQPTKRANYPYDFSSILDALVANRQRAIARHAERQTTGVRVLIADTGLRGVSNVGLFTQDLFLVSTPDEFEQIAKDVVPAFEDPEEWAQHGTAVASVLLGWPFFHRVQQIEHARIKLIVKPIFSYRSENKDIRIITGYGSLIQKAVKDYRPQIVNLSISSTNKQEPLSFINTKDEGPLYVVAAGNSNENIDVKDIFPAKYGGMASTNVITVAAISVSEGDSIGFADFSNRGPTYVDIGAPGCSIPAVTWDKSGSVWGEKTVNGTSFAAPLVSFAAAMIKSEIWGQGEINAAETKRRLLVSADLHSGLGKWINHGRTLNLTKALYLYDDVLELSDKRLVVGDASFVMFTRGKEQEVTKIAVSCDGNARDLDINDVYKIRPNFVDQNGNTTTILYSRGSSSGVFLSSQCNFPPDLKIRVRQKNQDLIELKLSEIRDLVRRFR